MVSDPNKLGLFGTKYGQFRVSYQITNSKTQSDNSMKMKKLKEKNVI